MSDLGARTVVLVGGDLVAGDRVERAAAAASLRFIRVEPTDRAALDAARAADLVLLDLDAGGRELIERWGEIAGDSGPRALGYFSHVDEALGRDARDHGIEAIPRGRFWRTLAEILAGA